MKRENRMKVEFLSKSQNEAFARGVIAAFVSQLDPTIEEIADIKTAVSEAVTNAIVHGYGHGEGLVTLACTLCENNIQITVEDTGKGIQDVKKAVMPLYTNSTDQERSGMGFTVMEAFMDTLEVISEPGKGTKVILSKKIGQIPPEK